MPSKKGIPANLKELADQGKRVRFNGFWLNDSDQDRAIADWIDQTPAAGTIIKHVLFMYITGQGMTIPTGPEPGSDDFELSDDDDIALGLLDFDD